MVCGVWCDVLSWSCVCGCVVVMCIYVCCTCAYCWRGVLFCYACRCVVMSRVLCVLVCVVVCGDVWYGDGVC